MTDSAKPVILCIMDGWGHGKASDYNAVYLAGTPAIDALDATCPKAFLLASGPAVGLPEGQVGNSEVGHMTIGAGRVIRQDLARIDSAVADGSIKNLPALDAFAKRLKESGGVAHLMGLVSDGGVHSHETHIMALAEALTARDIPVAIHAFTDGRDTLPRAARETLPEFEKALPQGARIATVIGRYYAMDRDRRWERTEAAWNLITHAKGDNNFPDLATMFNATDKDDEFLPAINLGDYDGMHDGDGVVFANFRADRVRQLLRGFCFDKEDCDFDISGRPQLIRGLGMTSYSNALDEYMDSIFPDELIPHTLGDVVARAGLQQLRLAETEKYPHVTFFLNGGREAVSRGEGRMLIPSPKVATYDLQPEMSAAGVLEALLDAIAADMPPDLIIVNFANPDMVGHTGSLEAAIKAVETVDAAIGRITAALAESGGVMLLTADHGNCEVMWDTEAESPHTAHTYNPVPLWLVGGRGATLMGDGGTLADLAPTLLELLGLEKPGVMTGKSLLRRGA